jgi:beta-lactamase class A
MHRRRHHQKKRNKKKFIIIGLLIVTLIAAIAAYALLHDSSKEPAAKPVKSASKKKETKPETPAAPKVELQPTIDTWVAAQSGDYGIVVYDVSNKSIIASHQPDKQYFTASIYKLYVAYLTLLDFQSGAQDPNAVIIADQTRKECIYKMIHSSDSPCGEAVLNDTGQADVTERLKKDFELTGTAFPAFTTNAHDATLILTRIQANKELSKENTDFLLDAMKTQIYRTGLPKGMPEATIADKIGFDSPTIWHDTAIVTLPNNRVYIVSILGGSGVSSKNIADFGQTIYAKLNIN